MLGERPEHKATWTYAAPVLAVLHGLVLLAIYSRPGVLGAYLWHIGPLVLSGATIVVLGIGLQQALRRRLVWTPWRAAGYLGLVLLAGMPLAYRTYPSSRDDRPSHVQFRLPLDGPVTVIWGGPTREVNYHVRGAAERWAYDLVVTEGGRSFRSNGEDVRDYFAYGLPVLAPADGIVRAASDGEPDSGVGSRSLLDGCGNRLVIEVATDEYLFLCHLQPGSVAVREGDRVTAGQQVGRVGNSGNSTEPHVHIHLQTTPGRFGEGIPLYFHEYRAGEVVVPRGMPTGGRFPQIVEHAGAAVARTAAPAEPPRGARQDD